jgi:O-antigen/teichoic acid export membrane protein
VTSTDTASGPSLWAASAPHLRIGRVFVIVLIGAILQVVTQTVLARALPKPDVGIISLLIGSLPLLSTITLLGQDSSTVRFLSRVRADRYDVASHVRRVLLLTLPLGAAIGLGGARYFALTGLAAATLAVLVVSQNATSIVTSVVRAARRYELAMMGTRAPVIATAVVLSVLFVLNRLTLEAALLVIMIAFGATALVLIQRGAGRTAGPSPAEMSAVPRSVIRRGFFFLGLSVSLSVMVALDKVIIGKMMPYSDLAVYATIFAVMKGFDFLFYSISYVMMPHVTSLERVNLRKYNVSLAGLAVAVSLFYVLLGGTVVHLLYGGRYDEGTYLILPFVLSGVLKLFYSLPSSIIGGRLPGTALKQFLWFNIAGMAANVVLDIVMIRAMGLLGAAFATALAWGLRLGGSYAVLFLNRSHLVAPPGVDTERGSA